MVGHSKRFPFVTETGDKLIAPCRVHWVCGGMRVGVLAGLQFLFTFLLVQDEGGRDTCAKRGCRALKYSVGDMTKLLNLRNEECR